MNNLLRWAACCFVLFNVSSCGILPLSIRIDSITIDDLDLDSIIGTLEEGLVDQGVLPDGLVHLPGIWEEGALPRLVYKRFFKSDATDVNVDPDDPENADKSEFKILKQVSPLVRRVEFNRLVVRFEENTINMPLPAIRVQLADDPNAHEDDRAAWRTVGVIPATPPDKIGKPHDLEVEWAPGGQLLFDQQLRDDEKKFAVRVSGVLCVDTGETDPLKADLVDLDPNSGCPDGRTNAQKKQRPRGKATLRLIVIGTFYADGENYL